VRDDLAEIDRNIRPGTAIGCGQTIRRLTKGPVLEEDMSPRAVVARIRADMSEFRDRNGLDGVVAVNVASTEPYMAGMPGFYRNLKALQGAIMEGVPGLTAGVLYAYAAFECGFPYVNFTPSPASDIPALQEMALERKIPHAGKDGKTGETLLKTALAPMFVARNFRVMSWEGYNMFGNRDAVVLDDPRNNEAKTRGKDRALRAIFGDPPDLHTRVRIDYVPSLDDWKTAWDFIHFRGFLGTKMIMQVIWQGCDSMLAAPLVLDLIRLADLARRRGEYGLMKHLCCFFKNPTGVDVHDFWAQMAMLKSYAAACLQEKRR
ncbi:MAG: inositol-3-phosphate synthase, partial [Planctomycetota bacterium]|nr:inositol-3-phosphate synthase [Planctomycetota bacterium]